MRYRIRHATRYDYSEEVPICYNQARLTPRSGPNQHLVSSCLEVLPVSPVMGRRRVDYFGNDVTYFTVQEPHRTLSVVVTSEVSLTPAQRPDPARTMAWEAARKYVAESCDLEVMMAYQFVFDSLFVREAKEWENYARPSFPAGRPILEGVMDLTARVHREFSYDPTATTIATPLETVMRARRGVCQDFAHLEIACLRAVGLPARYVSGYLYGGDRPGGLTGAWASHAWLAVYVPEAGWVDVDPTNNLMPSREHITLAWGRDYEDVSPIRGVVLGGGEHTLTVQVDITRLDEEAP
jgi:transglutaminase-like putative cysteine protease